MILSNYEFQHAPKRIERGGPKPDGTYHVVHYRLINGTSYHAETPYELVLQLEQAREQWNAKVRIWFGDTETGKPWAEEYDVTGRIGRSMGPIKIPLLVPRGACGGSGLLDHCIVRMADADTGRVLYQHPKFKFPRFSIGEPGPEMKARGYVSEVSIDGEVHARFRDEATAREWIRFMKGERFTHPEPDDQELVAA